MADRDPDKAIETSTATTACWNCSEVFGFCGEQCIFKYFNSFEEYYKVLKVHGDASMEDLKRTDISDDDRKSLAEALKMDADNKTWDSACWKCSKKFLFCESHCIYKFFNSCEEFYKVLSVHGEVAVEGLKKDKTDEGRWRLAEALRLDADNLAGDEIGDEKAPVEAERTSVAPCWKCSERFVFCQDSCIFKLFNSSKEFYRVLRVHGDAAIEGLKKNKTDEGRRRLAEGLIFDAHNHGCYEFVKYFSSPEEFDKFVDAHGEVAVEGLLRDKTEEERWSLAEAILRDGKKEVKEATSKGKTLLRRRRLSRNGLVVGQCIIKLSSSVEVKVDRRAASRGLTARGKTIEEMAEYLKMDADNKLREWKEDADNKLRQWKERGMIIKKRVTLPERKFIVSSSDEDMPLDDEMPLYEYMPFDEDMPLDAAAQISSSSGDECFSIDDDDDDDDEPKVTFIQD